MTLPLGFQYSALYAGIRKAKKDDLSLIVSDKPAQAAAVYTSNVVAAAPIQLARKHMAASKGVVKALLINAGNANCATRTGAAVALSTSKAVAKALGCAVEQVIPSSTGVIGVELNPALITNAVPALVDGLSADKFQTVADAIMTTDLVPKTAFATVQKTRIAGLTKGSGMIHPNMATTLGYVMTDAVIPAASLRAMLKRAIAVSYNSISVDGDQSTNDIVVVLANGASGIKPDLAKFEKGLTEVLQSLAKQIAKDGEGAKRLVTIDVKGAKTQAEAQRIGRSIANSPLVKTAIAGADPNWGRIICAAGYSGVAFDPLKVDIAFQGQQVCKSGLAAEFDEDALKAKLDAPEVDIKFTIKGAGKGTARFWTCDFTEGYIRINGSYRT
ncbi:MAG: bifunctional glutamate N-acetyltransferase/amino-acid acetyltransferase ArgJ [Acidobacteria bacterium]|nr:bifunctional glutamate N-acetyltransferase/amino-acid acetyltransferase ArgJ [Acidobacteriota bacterium]